jgi:glycosyltransferase involved in cell wall biosynthesis
MQINYAKLKLSITNPFIFVFSQNWYGFVKNLQRKKLIYYCVDDHSSFKGIDTEQFALLDKKMSQMADLIICSARTIHEHKKTYNKSSYYLPHGVNYDLFSSVVNDDNLTLASDISEFTKPVLGFWGHISYDWVDVVLLKYIAEKKPDWNLVLIGKYSLKENEFEGHTNIHVIGEKKFEELPSYCKGITIGLIPFIKSKLTDNCNPLKLYEYLAAGLPVVSTDIPEVRQYAELIAVAKTKEEFLASCEKALEQLTSEKSAIRSLSVKNASWEQRVEDIYKLINEE